MNKFIGLPHTYSGERMAGCTEITVYVQVCTKQYNFRPDIPSDIQPALAHNMCVVGGSVN